MTYSREYLKLREQYSVIGGNDNLMQSITERRNIKKLGEKALRRKRKNSMKHIEIRRKLTGIAIHVRRDMWGRIVRPSVAMRGFLDMRSRGEFHKDYTWRQHCAAFRKKRHKMRIAKESRRRNRR
jgi:hypothetical protein